MLTLLPTWTPMPPCAEENGPPPALLPPQPLAIPAAEAQRTHWVAGLVQALLADRTVHDIAAGFNLYTVACLYRPRKHYELEVDVFGRGTPDGGLCATCSCAAAPAQITDANLFAACWHVGLVVWLLTTPAIRAQWTRLYPDLALAWADYSARRRQEEALLRAGSLAYRAALPC